MPTRARADQTPHPIDVHVGRTVAEMRRAQGLTQSDLARAVGVTFQQVQKYERGTNRISASRLFQIAQFLGRSPSAFFPDDVDAVELDSAPCSRDAIEIARLAPLLKVAEQRTVLTLMRSLAGLN